MKNLIATSILIFLFFTGTSQTKNFIDQPYIEVNGNTDTLVTPDEIYIRITISESDTRNKTSVEEQEIKMVNLLKSLGINTEKDLTTNDILSNFGYYLLRNKDILKTKQYTLKVKDAVIAMKVFIYLEDLGISNASVDRVDCSQKENIKNMMRSKAIENARVRAMAMVHQLNQSVGNAIHIADNENYNENNDSLQGRTAGITANRYKSKVEADQLPSIEFDKIKIGANINVKFILN